MEELLSHGCRVLTCSRNQTELDELLEKYNPSSSSSSCCLYGVVANVATPEGRATLIHAIREYLGPKLDILVNNVGTNIRKASIDYENEDIQHIWNTNFHSMFALTTACHSFLKRSSCSSGEHTTTTQTSSVINIGSVAGVTCLKTGTPYAATKAAMNQITGNWACEWGPDGIRVNCVTPWYINTQLAKQVLKNKDYKRYTIISLSCRCVHVRLGRFVPHILFVEWFFFFGHRTVLERTPLGRVGEPEEVAGLVVFLCLPGKSCGYDKRRRVFDCEKSVKSTQLLIFLLATVAGYITGQVISVDGGFTRNGYYDSFYHSSK